MASKNWFSLITEDNKVYQMSLVDNVKVEETSKVSSAKVESKEVVSDNVVAYNPKISYNGIVTSIIRLDQDYPKSPEAYLQGLREERLKKTFFTCNLDDLLTPISFCQIENLSYEKTVEEGLTTWKVNIVLQQVRISKQATETTVPNPAVEDTTSETVDQGSATTKVKPKTAETIIAGGLGVLTDPTGG